MARLAAVRPACDVIVPFLGEPVEFRALVARLEGLELGEADTVTVADNRSGGADLAGAPDRIAVVRAPELQTPSFARNRGAASARGEWLVFVDADAVPEAGLLDSYFQPPPGERTAVLAGAVLDEGGDDARPAVRYAAMTAFMRQEATLDRERFGYAKTVNCAVRRDAFERVGGFAEGARAGEDADLCFRLADLGYGIEARYGARVTHQPRETVAGLIRQYFNHGSGAAWAARRHPGSFPASHPAGLALWSAGRVGAGLVALARGDRDGFVRGGLDAVCGWAFQLGRLRPNERR